MLKPPSTQQLPCQEIFLTACLSTLSEIALPDGWSLAQVASHRFPLLFCDIDRRDGALQSTMYRVADFAAALPFRLNRSRERFLLRPSLVYRHWLMPRGYLFESA